MHAALIVSSDMLHAGGVHVHVQTWCLELDGWRGGGSRGLLGRQMVINFIHSLAKVFLVTLRLLKN